MIGKNEGWLRRADVAPPAWVTLAVFSGLLLFTAIIVLRSAWSSDDAYITYRVVDNFWQGHGLRWNVAERVWVYTNPMMMLSMMGLYPLTGEFFYTGIFLGAASSLAAVGLAAVWIAPSLGKAIFLVAFLSTSKAFIDFSTSGLESCLTYLLLAVMYWLMFRRNTKHDVVLLAVSAVSALALLNRMDTILLFLPLLAVAWWEKRTLRRALITAVGFLPFVAWEVFALIYYGRLIPNTALAKLNTSIPYSYYLGKGVGYYAQSIATDPLTLPVIFSAFIAAALARRARHIAAVIGIALYLLYVLRIGGCFMGGRFFSGPFLAALMLWCVTPLPGRRMAWRAAGAAVTMIALAVSLSHPLSPLRATADYNMTIRPELQLGQSQGGVNDERGLYYPTLGLLRAADHDDMPAHPWRYSGEKLLRERARLCIAESIGIRSFYAGPGVHVLDTFALSDPLLSMLPVRRDGTVRIGHMPRYIPPDYIRACVEKNFQIPDKQLARLHTIIRRVHAGAIWAPERWRDIWTLNTGGYDHLIDKAYFTYPPTKPDERMKLNRAWDRVR